MGGHHGTARPLPGATSTRRVLLTGWFSFPDGEATAGDLESMATVAGWLGAAGIPFDVACSPVLGGLTLRAADPGHYTDLVFVCGPAAGLPVERLVARFAHCTRTAVGVSMVEGSSGLFDVTLARDDGGPGWPDLALGLDVDTRAGGEAAGGAHDTGETGDTGDTGDTGEGWPLVALVTANRQPEYGERARHHEVHGVIGTWLDHRCAAVVDVDTRIDPRLPRQRSAAQVGAILRAADVVVTTRLHGLVPGLRAGTPVVAVDPVAGGAKVAFQATSLGWPALLVAPEVTEDSLDRWARYCRSPAASSAVAASRRRATEGLARLRRAFVAGLLGR